MKGAWLLTGCATALCLTGCDSRPAPDANFTGTEQPDSPDPDASLLAAQRGCMTGALNNTLYRQQSDSQLESALFSQDLGSCPTDFIEAYVQLRNAARDYLRLSRELFAQQGREDDAHRSDDLNLLCSLIAGAQCAEWQTGQWREENAELGRRVDAARATMESSNANIETVIARYGLYVRNGTSPADAPDSMDNTM